MNGYDSEMKFATANKPLATARCWMLVVVFVIVYPSVAIAAGRITPNPIPSGSTLVDADGDFSIHPFPYFVTITVDSTSTFPSVSFSNKQGCKCSYLNGLLWIQSGIYQGAARINIDRFTRLYSFGVGKLVMGDFSA